MPNGVTREQIDLAKQVNILDYVLAHESNNVKRSGNAHYLKDHDSLRISNGLWKWESQGIGGKNVVDYLIKVRGYSFVDAVRHLTGDNIPAIHIAPRARPPTERMRNPVRIFGSKPRYCCTALLSDLSTTKRRPKNGT